MTVIRPMVKILTDDDLNDREKFAEFVETRAPRWSVRNAPDEEIVYLESWAGVDEFEGAQELQKVWAGESAPDEQEIQAPASLANEVGLPAGTYADIARRMLDPTAEW